MENSWKMSPETSLPLVVTAQYKCHLRLIVVGEEEMTASIELAAKYMAGTGSGQGNNLQQMMRAARNARIPLFCRTRRVNSAYFVSKCDVGMYLHSSLPVAERMGWVGGDLGQAGLNVDVESISATRLIYASSFRTLTAMVVGVCSSLSWRLWVS